MKTRRPNDRERPAPAELTDDVRDTTRRNPRFRGRCYLCGAPIATGIFCHAHSWAASR